MSGLGKCAVFVTLILTFIARGASSQAARIDTVAGDVLPMSRIHRMTSKVNGRAYVLTVALPPQYREGQQSDTAHYPTLYIMEESAGAFLRLTVPGFRFTHGPNANLIVVGVSPAPTPSGSPSVTALAKMDLSPAAFPYSDSANARILKEQAPGGGGAQRFVRALREDIVPFIERTYRANSDRGILGMSFSGMFAAYVLVNEPSLFTRYALISPSLWWNEGSIFRMEEALAARSAKLPATVFVSTGSNEWPNDIRDVFRLVGVLCDRLRYEKRYAGLEVIAAMNMDEFHRSSVAFERAMDVLYPREVDLRSPPPDAPIWPPSRVFCGPRAKW